MPNVTEEQIEACPFCADPMQWDQGHFTHTDEATNGGRCYFRHKMFHPEELDWWNTRAMSPSSPVSEGVETALSDARVQNPHAPYSEENDAWNAGFCEAWAVVRAALAAMPQTEVGK